MRETCSAARKFIHRRIAADRFFTFPHHFAWIDASARHRWIKSTACVNFIRADAFFIISTAHDCTFILRSNHLKLKMKLEGVILAAGLGSRMVELTRARPKCLLPVGNQPLLWYAITSLKSVGVKRILILVNDAQENEIKQYCVKKFGSTRDFCLEYHAVSSQNDCGTAESILQVRHKISGDFIVYSCDSIVDPKAVTYLVNHYRLYDPIMTMLLSDNPNYFETRQAPGRRDKERYNRDVIAIESLNRLDLTDVQGFSAAKLVFLHSERDLKRRLKIKNRELVLHPSLEIYSSFLDAHVYIFKNQMLDFMAQHSDLAVLKAEVIPILISKQFQKNDTEGDDLDDDVSDLGDYTVKDYDEELTRRLQNLHPHDSARSAFSQRTKEQRPFTCHTVIIKDHLVHRVNTLSTYLDSNCDAKHILQVYDHRGSNTIKDSVVGENTTLGNKCLLKKSTIGANCKIGDKAKLIECVVMDNVEIEANASLTQCILSNNTKIGTKSDLKYCIVGSTQIVPNGRKANGELIMDDSYVIDLSDPLVDVEQS